MARLSTITTASGGGGGESRFLAKRRASPLPPFLPDERPSYSKLRAILKRDECVDRGGVRNAAGSSRGNVEGTVRLSWTGMLRETLTSLNQSACCSPSVLPA